MTDSHIIPWIEKYRPQKLDDLTQDSTLIDLFRNSIKSGNITHFLFYGPPGTGKTSAILAIGREIFKEHFPTRVIEFNASDDRGINAVREKITNHAKKFVTTEMCQDGTSVPPYKIIILDEADSMTDEAQDALRVIIEKYSSVTRFCFICNYITKITDAIKSRCSTVYFKKLDYDCMLNKLNGILKKESVQLSNRVLDTVIAVSGGDMRKAIMYLQNLKYIYNFKKVIQKNLEDMSSTELAILSVNTRMHTKKIEVCELDVYDVAAYIDDNTAEIIIEKTFKCRNIREISVHAKNIVSIGYPIDNIIQKLNMAIMNSTKLTEIQKAIIIKYSGNIILKMKECANEYIQLLDYLSCIHGVRHNNKVYDIV